MQRIDCYGACAAAPTLLTFSTHAIFTFVFGFLGSWGVPVTYEIDTARKLIHTVLQRSFELHASD